MQVIKHPELFKKVLHLAIPAGFKQLLDILQILVDMLMVGSLGIASLAAVGISMQFMMILNVLMTIYIVGGSTVIARRIGSRQFHRANSTFFTLILFASVMAFLVSILGINFSANFYSWMGSQVDVIAEGERYFSLLSYGMLFIFLDTLFFNALSAAGNSKSSLYIKIVSIVVNILLNYTLIFGNFGVKPMGIEGAALATIVAYILNVLLYAVVIFQKDSHLKIFIKFNVAELKKVLKVGVEAAVERLGSVIGFIIFVVVITHYGTQALAGYQVGLRIEGVAFMPGFGFSIAAMALVGQALGAKNLDEAYRAGLYSAVIAMFFMGSIGVFLFIFPEFFISFFTQDSETMSIAKDYLQLVALAQVPLALAFVISAILRASAMTRLTLKINVLSLWFLRVIPSLLLFYFGGAIFWIFVIMNIETAVKGFIFWKIFKKREWQKLKI